MINFFINVLLNLTNTLKSDKVLQVDKVNIAKDFKIKPAFIHSGVWHNSESKKQKLIK